MSKRKLYTDQDVRAFLQQFTGMAIACVQPVRQQRIALAVNAAIHNHAIICSAQFASQGKLLKSKNQTEWFAYAGQLVDMRVQATGFAIQDSDDPARVQEVSDMFTRLNALNEIALGVDRAMVKHMGQDCSPEIPLYVEAIVCCCTAAIIGRTAVEIWPVPPALWQPHKYMLKDSGYTP